MRHHRRGWDGNASNVSARRGVAKGRVGEDYETEQSLTGQDREVGGWRRAVQTRGEEVSGKAAGAGEAKASIKHRGLANVSDVPSPFASSLKQLAPMLAR